MTSGERGTTPGPTWGPTNAVGDAVRPRGEPVARVRFMWCRPLRSACLLALGLLASGAAGAAAPDFMGAAASPEVRQLARWALATRDPGGRSLVLVDKKQARVFVLDPQGRLKGSAPALLGLARGDHTVPGIGDRPLSQVRPSERTTPAGRFIPEPGRNTQGEDVVWVDYEAAVSMHRVRAQVKSERRLERLASATAADNRISYGCINLPAAFYEQVLLPAVRSRAVVYVLPELRTLAEVFPGLSQPTP